MTRGRERRAGIPLGVVVFVVVSTLYVMLGNEVSHIPPAGVDTAAHGVAGEAPGFAWILTESCLWPVLTMFGVVGCAAAIRFPAWRARIIFAIVTTLVTWQISDALKNLFARPRPDYWIVHHETTYSYSSGHAMFATLVYWLWAYHVARSSIATPVRVLLIVILAGWGAGVIWSRLALGAHYPTDLAGGILLALAMLALASVVARWVAPRARVF